MSIFYRSWGLGRQERALEMLERDAEERQRRWNALAQEAAAQRKAWLKTPLGRGLDARKRRGGPWRPQ